MSEEKNQHTIEEDGEEVEEGAPMWVVSFGDMMSLLLCFFIILFAMSSVNETKFKQLLQSIKSALGVQNVPEAGTREGLEMQNKEGEKKENAVDELGGLVTKEMTKIKSDVEEFIFKNKLAGQISVKIDGRGAVITVSDVIIFRPGEARITTRGYPVMRKLFELLKKFNYRIRVEGHTDNVPISTPRFPSNWELSTSRACELVRYFINMGIDPRRLSAEGFSKYRPIADNSTPEGRAKNRRVEIVYIREDMERAIERKLKSMQPATAARQRSSGPKHTGGIKKQLSSRH